MSIKKTILLVLFLLGVCYVQAQNNYGEAIRQDDAALKKGEYQIALDK